MTNPSDNMSKNSRRDSANGRKHAAIRISPLNVLLLFIKKIFLIVFFAGIILGMPIFIATPTGQYWYWTLDNTRAPVLTWTDSDSGSGSGVNTTGTITISWETNALTSSRVEISTSSGLISNVVTIQNATLTKFHCIKIGGLSPNMRYYYRVSSIELLDSKISQIHSFITAPDKDQPIHFAIYGDTRDSVNGLQAVANGMMAIHETKPFNFVVHVGDLVGEGGNRGAWNQFFKRTAELHASIPLVPALGNHEWYGEANPNYIDEDFPNTNKSYPEHYLKNFNLPNNERYYSINMSNLHYIILDSNEPGRYFYRNTDENKNMQVQWLYNDLIKTNTTFDWIFVSYHHPEDRYMKYNITTQTGPRSMTINEVFAESGVDAVVIGHYHTYERQWLTVSGRTIPYIINGGGGADLDGGLCWNPEKDKSNERTVIQYSDIFEFMEVSIDNTNLAIKAIDYMGNTIDSLSATVDGGWVMD